MGRRYRFLVRLLCGPSEEDYESSEAELPEGYLSWHPIGFRFFIKRPDAHADPYHILPPLIPDYTPTASPAPPALPTEHRAQKQKSRIFGIPVFGRLHKLPHSRAHPNLRARFLAAESSASSRYSTAGDRIIPDYEEVEMGMENRNELLSSVKSSDLSLKAQLHSLVLMNISNHITSHTQRKQQGPVVGLIIGQQNGRDITLEFVVEAHAVLTENGDMVIPDAWLALRLTQMKNVHKELDLVGWYTLIPQTGPQINVLPIHHQILKYNESAILLGLHNDALVAQVQAKGAAGGKIPVTIYESYYEVDDASKDTSAGGEDKEMKDGDATLKLKFRVIPHSFTTDEAEMICMDYIVGGAGNALAAEVKAAKAGPAEVDVKGKRRAVPDDLAAIPTPENVMLSKEDEEVVSGLVGKVNATKMLKSRIDLATNYLEQLPPSGHNSDAASVRSNASNLSNSKATPSYLRQMQSVSDRLNLLSTPTIEDFSTEVKSEANDVHSIAMLDEMATAISDMRDVGKRQHVVESAKNQSRRAANDFASGGGGSGYSVPGAGDLL